MLILLNNRNIAIFVSGFAYIFFLEHRSSSQGLFSIVTLNSPLAQVVSSAIVDKYIGESARLIREMFNYARDHQPCIIFMDEIDAIGGRRFSEGTSADREIQRTLMELLNQMDGFDTLGKVRREIARPACVTLTPTRKKENLSPNYVLLMLVQLELK